MRWVGMVVVLCATGCLSVSSSFPEVDGDSAGGDSAAGDPAAMGDTAPGDPMMGGDTFTPPGDPGPPLPCDGTAQSYPCFSLGECPSGPCMDDGNDCTVLACEGADTNERFACADTEDLNNWDMAGLPCLTVSCTNETSENGPNAIGADCYGSNATISILYSFRTESTGIYNIFMRNIVDANWDNNAFYTCSITNAVAGTVNFEFREDALNSGSHGPGCAGVMAQDEYCWMHADSDPMDADIDRFNLNAGSHNLTCSISLDSVDEFGGFDGIIVVNNIGFRPDEPTMGDCSDSDQVFTSGSCSTVNWGPNLARTPGLCNRFSPLADETICATSGGDTCCSGACVVGAPPGTCP